MAMLFLSSCSFPPPEAYKPPPENYEARIKARTTRELSHPEGAQYTFEKPGRIWQADIIPHGNPVETGYQVLFWVRDGGGRSDTEWYANFYNDKITDIGTYQDPLFQ